MQATVPPSVCQAASTWTSRPPVQHVQTASRPCGQRCADSLNALDASADADWSMLTLADVSINACCRSESTTPKAAQPSTSSWTSGQQAQTVGHRSDVYATSRDIQIIYININKKHARVNKSKVNKNLTCARSTHVDDASACGPPYVAGKVCTSSQHVAITKG